MRFVTEEQHESHLRQYNLTTCSEWLHASLELTRSNGQEDHENSGKNSTLKKKTRSWMWLLRDPILVLVTGGILANGSQKQAAFAHTWDNGIETSGTSWEMLWDL